MIVDVTIPHAENLVKAEKDKQIKYLDLAHVIVDMWDVDSAIIVPIVVTANGLIAKSLDQHLKRLSLGGWIKGLLQKAVLLDTARIVQPGAIVNNLIAPLSSQSTTLAKATVTGAIRQVILCKDKDGKCGIRLHSVNSGVFVCYVAANSPAALAGLRFGDQILEINNVALAGMTMDQCHALLKKSPANGITLAVRDRPFERTLTLHKDSVGHVGFQFKEGRIVGLVKDSSAARNGLLTDHQILEINTINVVGMKDKEISKIIDASQSVVNITIIPCYIYQHMINKMSSSLFKELDRTPAV